MISKKKSKYIVNFDIKRIIILISLTIFLIVGTTRNNAVVGDSRGTLLTAQSIIEFHTIKLDNYKNLDKNFDYQIYKKNGHYYYYFPLGSSISSIPFVWIATQLLPLDMNNKYEDAVIQKGITAFISILIFFFLFKIAKFYFDDKFSVAIAFCFWLSTSLSSTLAKGLWPQDFATLYAVISIYLTLFILKNRSYKPILWVILGITLFMAYLSRPTMSLLVISIILFLFFNHKKDITIKVSILIAILLTFFILFSLNEYNQILPDYYMPKRLNSNTFWTAIYGNLFSPSRGLFVFSPFLLIFLLNIKTFYNIVRRDKTLLIFVSWIILHLIVISKFPHWWGGFSYGSRLMVDVLIPIYLLFLILINEILKNRDSLQYKLNLVFLSITIPLSIYINTYQGLYNRYTLKWNAEPNIDRNPQYLLDWRYPQFLHNKSRHKDRLKEFNKYFDIDNLLKFNSQKIKYNYGWSHPEKDFIWSIGKESQLSIKLDDKRYKGVLILDIYPLDNQTIKIYLNSKLIFNGEINPYSEYIKIPFDSKLIKVNQINTLKFEYSNPHRPNKTDNRELAIALKALVIE